MGTEIFWVLWWASAIVYFGLSLKGSGSESSLTQPLLANFEPCISFVIVKMISLFQKGKEFRLPEMAVVKSSSLVSFTCKLKLIDLGINIRFKHCMLAFPVLCAPSLAKA